MIDTAYQPRDDLWTRWGGLELTRAAVDESNARGKLEVTIGWPAGISPARTNTLKVYPNPASNELNIVLERENSTISIYNPF